MNKNIFKSIIAGVIGIVVGAISMAGANLGPARYAWALAALTMPAAWLGGNLAIKKQ